MAPSLQRVPDVYAFLYGVAGINDHRLTGRQSQYHLHVEITALVDFHRSQLVPFDDEDSPPCPVRKRALAGTCSTSTTTSRAPGLSTSIRD